MIRHFTLLVFAFLFFSCAKVFHPTTHEVSSMRFSQKVAEADTAIEALIAPFRDTLQKEMDQVIGLLAVSLEKKKVESSMGNFVADAILAQAKLLTRENLDLGICNYGGMRIPALAAGPVTKGHIFELVPFDNYLVTMEIPGDALEQLFALMANDGGWPISAGVSYGINKGKPENITINDMPLDLSANYKIALSDYLAEGGSDCDFLKAYPYENLGVFYRDAIIEYIQMRDAISESIDSRVEGRVILIEDQ